MTEIILQCPAGIWRPDSTLLTICFVITCSMCIATPRASSSASVYFSSDQRSSTCSHHRTTAPLITDTHTPLLCHSTAPVRACLPSKLFLYCTLALVHEITHQFSRHRLPHNEGRRVRHILVRSIGYLPTVFFLPYLQKGLVPCIHVKMASIPRRPFLSLQRPIHRQRSVHHH